MAKNIIALFLLLYAAMCFYIGFQKPPKLIRLVRMKMANKVDDAGAAKASYVAAAVAVVIAILIMVL